MTIPSSNYNKGGHLPWFFLFTLAVLSISACGNEGKNLKTTDETFVNLLFDVELAREAARSASAAKQDSLLSYYFDQIGARYDLTAEEIRAEIQNRIDQNEDMDAEYDLIRTRIDSLVKSIEKLH